MNLFNKLSIDYKIQRSIYLILNTIFDFNLFTWHVNLEIKFSCCDLQVHICFARAKSSSLLFSGYNEN